MDMAADFKGTNVFPDSSAATNKLHVYRAKSVVDWSAAVTFLKGKNQVLFGVSHHDDRTIAMSY